MESLKVIKGSRVSKLTDFYLRSIPAHRIKDSRNESEFSRVRFNKLIREINSNSPINRVGEAEDRYE